MSTVIRQPRPASMINSPTTATPAHVQVWDVSTRIMADRQRASVRTLVSPPRTTNRTVAVPRTIPNKTIERADAQDNIRGSVVLGALLGAALIVGSTIGGAFSADAGSTPSVDTTREVQSAHL
ncbi:hypothetical protein [Corynebacterium mayonis]|uniref:hypothetical protein n=1 Tax=Corynebacterium mayonis TaxID=3062461 RepID=UPI0031400234